MKPARNQSCPCGSGKKFKRCCGQGKDHLNEVPADIYQTFQLALAHHAAGEFDRAAALYRSIIATRPLPEAYNNLGNVLKDQGNIAEATAYYQQALKLRPVYADAEYNLADTLQTERRYEDAVTHYRRALKLVPDDVEALAGYVHTLQQICDWSEINALSKRLMELIAKPDSNAIFPFALLSLPADLRLQQSNARKASRYVKRKVGTVAPAFRAIARGDRLRIGYLSADFHDHPTAYLIAELLELHDRSRFEIVGYSTGTGDGKEMRQRIAVACDEFFDLRSHSSADAAARIREDKTNILVDLKGTLCENRDSCAAACPRSGELPRISWNDGGGFRGLHHRRQDRHSR